MAPGRPILGLAVGPEPPVPLVRLLVEMRVWCAPRAAEPDLPADAWLATSPDAAGVELAAATRGPLAVWCDDAGQLGRVEALRPALVLTSDVEIVERVGAVQVSSDPDAPADRIAVIPPFVRERIRRRAGLPARLVTDLTSGLVPEALVPAALAVCSACVVTGARLHDAMAWGAPTVTDPDSAAAAGVHHGQEVLVGSASEHADLAGNLSRDAVLAARLSLGARRFAEARSMKRVAALVAERLELIRAPAAAIGPRVDAILRQLSLPASPLQPDVARVLAALEQPGPAAAVAAGASGRS